MRLGFVGAVVVAGLVVWGAGIASASVTKAGGKPAVGRPATGAPKVGHLGTPVSRVSRSGKGHRFTGVVPFSVLRNYNIQTSVVSVPNGTQTGTTANCAAGTVVVGGGAYTNSNALGSNVNTSAPSGTTQWQAYESNTTGGTDTLTAYAICAKQPRYYAIESASVDSPAGSQKFLSVACPATYKALGVGASESSFDTAVNLNGLIPFKATHPTSFAARVWGNNASIGDSTLTGYAVCGKFKGYSLQISSGVSNPAGSQDFVGVACPSGTAPMGGGILATSLSTAANVSATYPNPGFTGWGAFENNASGGGETITAYAACAL